MTQQFDPRNRPSWEETADQVVLTTEEAQRQLRAATELLNPEFSKDIAFLRRIFGIGRRVIVPPGQIHVVRGTGWLSWRPNKTTVVYGVEKGDEGSLYILNPLTEVTVLVTKSFQVPVVNLHALDKTRVRFTIDAFVVAGLNKDSAKEAAEKMGGDPQSLINVVTNGTASGLLDAAAQMDLAEIVTNRSKLVELARPSIEASLENLGYNLVVLRIVHIRGEAVDRWQQQALAEVSKEATVKTNAAQLAEAQNRAEREEREATINADKEEKVKADERRAELADAQKQHDLRLKGIEREREAATQQHGVNLQNVELGEGVALREVARTAAVKERQMVRDAEIRTAEVARQAHITLAEQQAEDDRAKLEQENRLAREADRIEADAERLAREKSAEAERERKVVEIQAQAKGQALTIEATAEADRTRTVATARADAAVQEAKATESSAAARIKEAEATRAQEAAVGLARAQVSEREAQVALVQAEAEKAKGLAQAEVERASAAAKAEGEQLMRQVEIKAQEALATLYQQNPVLVELERLSRELAHQQRMAQINMDGQIAMMTALAPQLTVDAKLIGNGGQMGALLSQILTLSTGYDAIVEEVPALGGLLGKNWRAASALKGLSGILGGLFNDVNLRMFGSLTLRDLVDRVIPVVEGESDLQTFLQGLKKDARFKLIGNVPITELIGKLIESGGQRSDAQTDVPIG